jgi:hypothetical protein
MSRHPPMQVLGIGTPDGTSYSQMARAEPWSEVNGFYWAPALETFAEQISAKTTMAKAKGSRNRICGSIVLFIRVDTSAFYLFPAALISASYVPTPSMPLVDVTVSIPAHNFPSGPGDRQFLAARRIAFTVRFCLYADKSNTSSQSVDGLRHERVNTARVRMGSKHQSTCQSP